MTIHVQPDEVQRLAGGELDELVDVDRAHLWHPFTPMRTFDPGERMFVRARDCTVWDAAGREYLDAFAGLWSVNAGHNHPRIVAAIVAQLQELCAAPLFSSAHPSAAALAGRLAALCPGDLDRVFFSVQGSQAVETGLKLARAYWKAVGRGGKYKVIARDRAYHGTAFGGTSAQGIAANRATFEPLVPGFSHIAAPLPSRCEMCDGNCRLACASALEHEIVRQGPETVAAFIVEPLAGTGGVIPAPAGYLERIREICSRHDVLLIADEVMTGFGRTGSMFAIEHAGIVPDVLLLSKGLTSGHLPMAATVAREPIYAAVVDGARAEGIEFATGATFDGYPPGCAAALANLDVLEDEQLVARAAREGALLQQELSRLRSHDLVADVRGLGMVAGVELSAPRALAVAREAYARGVIVRPLVGGEVVAVAPPLTIEPAQIRRIGEVLAAALDAAA